jgi:hypothetical protein
MGATTLSITTVCIVTNSTIGLFVTLSIPLRYRNAKCHVFYVMINVVMQNGIMLRVVAPMNAVLVRNFAKQ